jgi:hypothetical protein
MLFKIPFRSWTLRAALEIEIPDDTAEAFRMRAALQIAVGRRENLRGAVLRGAVLCGAVLRGADLSGADLRDAVLRDADLSGADLRGAVLSGADLRGAVLRGADLSGADLRDAVLRDAVLRDADLSGADLRDAVLRDADLRDADLRGADLSGADLRDADLSGADLRDIRNDVFDILLRAKSEVPTLLAALRAGKIDGSTYSGPCACLCGTLEQAKAAREHCDVQPFDFRDSSRPAERWFLGINPGDTPDNHAIAKITEGWILEFMSLIGMKDESAQVES